MTANAHLETRVDASLWLLAIADVFALSACAYMSLRRGPRLAGPDGAIIAIVYITYGGSSGDDIASTHRLAATMFSLMPQPARERCADARARLLACGCVRFEAFRCHSLQVLNAQHSYVRTERKMSISECVATV